jgi:hypothetical protein
MLGLVMEMCGSGAPQLRVPGPAEFSAEFPPISAEFRTGTIAAQSARMSLRAMVNVMSTTRGTCRAAV